MQICWCHFIYLFSNGFHICATAVSFYVKIHYIPIAQTLFLIAYIDKGLFTSDNLFWVGAKLSLELKKI